MALSSALYLYGSGCFEVTLLRSTRVEVVGGGPGLVNSAGAALPEHWGLPEVYETVISRGELTTTVAR